MKKLIYIIALFWINSALAQNYPNILNYSSNVTPIYGVKIKTNLPFTPSSQMPTININGFNYGTGEPINLTLVYYIYSDAGDFNNPAKYFVHTSKISSAGAYTPRVYLSNEAGKVVVYIDDKVYFQRFTVSAYAQGMNELATFFQGWTAVDEAMTGTQTVEVLYANRFKGDVYLSGNGIWNGLGNVGIGTLSPTEKLSVNGKIRAKEVKVEAANWPDYVFQKEYPLLSLRELETYIKTNGHLPELPTAKEVESNGFELGEMNKQLVKKIEELTLYLIDKDKKITLLEEQGIKQEKAYEAILLRIKALEKQ